MSPVLALDRLRIGYGHHRALCPVTLAIPRGEITALIGPSGCGKTSLLNSLNRMTDLIPGCRVDGRILLEGDDIHAPGTDLLRLRRRVGMIFQHANPFPLSIRRNLDLPLREHGVTDPGERADRAQAALQAVGLWDEVARRLDAAALALSGGQQQRLCIARALALEPEVLLMDEPCSALDPGSTEVIEALMRGLRGRISMVVVTHNLGQARRLADTVAMFWHGDAGGRLIEYGPARQVFEAPQQQITAGYVAGRLG